MLIHAAQAGAATGSPAGRQRACVDLSLFLQGIGHCLKVGSVASSFYLAYRGQEAMVSHFPSCVCFLMLLLASQFAGIMDSKVDARLQHMLPDSDSFTRMHSAHDC